MWEKNRDLQSLHSFGFQHRARYFLEIPDLPSLHKALKWIQSHGGGFFVLGEGTNLFFTSQISRPILRLQFRDKEILRENSQHVYLRVEAGHSWSSLVSYCLTQGWSGMENLIDIPGSVGAAPVQNIGAYGSEISELIDFVEAIHASTGKPRVFTPAQCRFKYRESIFKHLPGQYIITHVGLRVNKSFTPRLSYPDLKDLQEKKQLSPEEVAHRVSHLRAKKLPKLGNLGHAGSFFKNPILSQKTYEKLQNLYSTDFKSLPISNHQVKISAAELIEKSGWKGFRRGSVGVHPQHALVLVHYGGGRGSDLLGLAKDITESVQTHSGIRLSPEVEIISQ
ncbi:MAG: UDP-N-acetylmuramate dehydrogenase [Cytophagales bacterium]|nr:UDP-N-acetylmuramate dehydrogenase [Cytophagales bacterium]